MLHASACLRRIVRFCRENGLRQVRIAGDLQSGQIDGYRRTNLRLVCGLGNRTVVKLHFITIRYQ